MDEFIHSPYATIAIAKELWNQFGNIAKANPEPLPKNWHKLPYSKRPRLLIKLTWDELDDATKKEWAVIADKIRQAIIKASLG